MKKSTRGRPRFEPTPEQRILVERLASRGIRHEDICQVAFDKPIAPNTLALHFREELDRGRAHANVVVAKSLFELATGGNAAAAIFWLKTKAGWKTADSITVQHLTADGAPAVDPTRFGIKFDHPEIAEITLPLPLEQDESGNDNQTS